MSYLVKGIPFRFKGTVNVEDCKTSEEVITKAGLNWDVNKCRLFAEMPVDLIDDITQTKDNFIRGAEQYTNIERQYGIYRTDINIPLGIVKEKYTPVQNIDAFNFFNDAIGKDKAIWQTAGSFGYGERIFVSAKLPDTISVKGDPVDNYLVFTNSHDGSSGVKILFTPIRVICENTLNAAIRTTTNYVTFRHTKNVHNNLDIAKEILGITKTKIIAYSEICDYLAKQTCNDKYSHEFIANFILSDNEKAALKQFGYTEQAIINRNYNAMDAANISTRKVNTITDMIKYYHSGVGQKEIEGTRWGVLNAITGYYSNVDNNIGEKRMDTLLYGDRSNKIKQATELLIAA